MRSGLFRLATTSAAVLSGLVALASVAPAHAQPKPAAKPAAQPAKPAAKPAAAPAKPAAAPAKPAAAPAKPAAAPAKADPKVGAKADPKAAPLAGAKLACAAEPKKNLADAKKKDEAKKAFGEGKTRFDKGEYENAHSCFKLADAYVPGAQPKYRIAASLDKLGKVQEAVAAYDAFLAFVGPAPDDKFKEIVADAKTRTAALKATPSKVKVAIAPAGLPNTKITVDGAPQAGTELTLAPGKRTIVVSADGYDASTQVVEIGFAETRDVSVTLTQKAPEPVATVAPTATAAPTATVVASAPTSAPTTGPVAPAGEKSNIPAYVTLGLAGAGAVVGGIFGGLALASKDEFDKNPTVEKADETDRNALIADMSFAVALTFGVTGAVLLLTDTGATTTAPPAKTGAGPQKPKKASLPRGFIAPYAGPTGGGAAARFTF